MTVHPALAAEVHGVSHTPLVRCLLRPYTKTVHDVSAEEPSGTKYGGGVTLSRYQYAVTV